MGLFDKFLRALGFDGEEEKEKEVKKNKNADITNSKFNLSKVQENEEETAEEETKVFTPETQEDIQDCLTKIENTNESYINLENFSDEDQIRALDFISGALFILKKSIKRVDAKLFIIKNLEE